MLEHVTSVNVFVYGMRVGSLRMMDGKYTFIYRYDTPESLAVSMALPVVPGKSYVFDRLPTFFTQSLPQGSARARMNDTYKNIRGFNSLTDMDVMVMTGKNQIGRVAFTRPDITSLEDIIPFEIDKNQVINTTNGNRLFYNLSNKPRISEGSMDGIPGQAPKLLVDCTELRHDIQRRSKRTLISSKEILKASKDSIPWLCVIEDACLNIARSCRFKAPDSILSRDGSLLLVRRFDRIGRSKIGFDDFSALLNAKSTTDGTYEDMFKAIDKMHVPNDYECDKNAIKKSLFARIVLSNLVHDDDLHLKNAGIVYTKKQIKFAPTYDVVCTDVIHIPSPNGGLIPLPSRMALKWKRNEHDAWKPRGEIIAFAESVGVNKDEASRIVDSIANGIESWLKISKENDHPIVQEIHNVVRDSLTYFKASPEPYESLDPDM